jgi:hypothetical protein
LDRRIRFNLKTHFTKQITAVSIVFKTAFKPRNEKPSNKYAVKVKVNVNVKVKVKFNLEQATKVQRGSGSMDILFL